MKKLTVQASHPYDIEIESGLLAQCGQRIRTVSDARQVMVVTDTHVSPLYLGAVCASLRESGFTISSCAFPAGEQTKNLQNVSALYDMLAEKEFTRSDLLVALGGGVIGDLTGFAAATFLRGMDFVQIPTTLLAQVDSSVGGKTGVNIESGKNLVGAFKQPRLVLCDPAVLSTLPETVFADGMAEVIKYGCIKSLSLFNRLLTEDLGPQLEEIIFSCIDIKRQAVEADEFDTGERMLLNFGHTLGHAIEKNFHYEGFSHGSAVAVGMAYITARSEAYGITQAGTTEKLLACLKKYGLPTTADISEENLIRYSLNDKKRSKNTLHIVLLHALGDGFLFPISTDGFQSFVKGEYTA